MKAEVSVVVPVGPRIADLATQLDALAAQVDHPGFEVILSRNGGEERAVLEAVAATAWPPGVIVKIIDSSDRRGPSHARNVGARHASGDLLLFCDADDMIGERWVAEMARALRRAPLVGGRLDYESLNEPGLASWGLVSADGLAHKFGHLPFAGSCNLGVRAELFNALGGFDEDLSASEDVDLCWRAQYLGFPLAMAPAAVVAYRRRAEMRELFRQARNDARNDPALLQRHRARGATWTLLDLLREAAGVGAALAAGALTRAGRLRLATRGGRLLGHLRELGPMLVA